MSAAAGTALVWLRRDLRVADNVALVRAASERANVVPVFVLDDAILRSPRTAPRRVALLVASLESLSKNLEKMGSRLVLRRGEPARELVALAREVGADLCVHARDFGPFALSRDARVARALASASVRVVAVDDLGVHAPEAVRKPDGGPYAVFTPWFRAWSTLPRSAPLARPRSLGAPRAAASLALPSASDLGVSIDPSSLPRAGERAARDALSRFLAGPVATYVADRDRVAVDGTSSLSWHLRFGTISARTVVAEATKLAQAEPAARDGARAFVRQVAWRDFYLSILRHHPHVARGAFREEYDALAWENDREKLDAWRAGATGFPLVDAAMRELASTGRMHNRLRMIVASFLTKDLLVDWRLGERHFSRELLDYDLAANNGGWQWAAGTGTDAQPWFRIFNPASQAAKFDPDGAYVARFAPEVAAGRGCRPIVDHATQRQRALALYRAVRGSGCDEGESGV